MANEVEIRFRITNEKTTPQAATPSAGGGPPSAITRTLAAPQDFSQRERDVEEKTERAVKQADLFARFEKRLTNRLMRMGARLVAAEAFSELSSGLGENAFVSRLGASAIQGGMMGGAVGAGVLSLTTIVHELINQVKANSEEVKRVRLEQIQKEEKNNDLFITFKEDLRSKIREQEEKNEEAIRAYNQRALDYVSNAVKYITVPYTGVG